MRTLLKSLIIPQIEYGSIIWAPGTQYLTDTVESVLRSFSSKISCFRTYDNTLGLSISTTDYKDRLQELKLYSMQRRMERYFIIHIHKILIGYLPNPGLSFHVTSRNGWYVTPKYTPRGVPNWITACKENSFFVKAPLLYNSIDPSLKQPVNLTEPPGKKHVKIFKNALDKYLQRIVDDPDRKGRNSLLGEPILKTPQP
jgi:hypothetical protein